MPRPDLSGFSPHPSFSSGSASLFIDLLSSKAGKSSGRSLRQRLAGSALAAALSATGCDDSGASLAPSPPPPEPDCELTATARTFEVFFVIDVSRSMVEFLEDLATQLSSLAFGFPERDALDRRVLVSYYVVAFVNDVKLFPELAERMTSHIAVSGAIRGAIEAAEGNRNLLSNTPNSDTDENLLDALGAVIDRAPSADSILVLLATDAGFREAPESLSGGVTVTRTYDDVKASLERLGARIYALVPGELDGLTRPYRGRAPLTASNGSQVFDLFDLAGAQEQIDTTLEGIARDATCNPVASSL